MARPLRRVVTGHDETGKAVVVADSAAPVVRSDPHFSVEVSELWLTDRTPADNSGSAEPGLEDLPIQPPAGGSIFRIVEFAPIGDDPRAAIDPAKGSEHPFAHRTDTIDYQIVLAGEIDMVLDDSVVHLETGDIVVQRGTNHAWVNRGDVPCVLAAVQIDADPL
jgi:mannose-6-phosphate isomerase-like protein (cupin superfamily)